MAEFTKEQIQEVVTRTLAQVNREAQVSEQKAFAVSDLHSQVVDRFGGGGQSAWEITYKTSSAVVAPLDPVSIGKQAAWEISYKTSSATIQGGDLVKK
jgi:hypothetical protein